MSICLFFYVSLSSSACPPPLSLLHVLFSAFVWHTFSVSRRLKYEALGLLFITCDLECFCFKVSDVTFLLSWFDIFDRNDFLLLKGICLIVESLLSALLLQQQLQAHQLSQLQGLALPMTPLPLGLSQPAGLPAVTSSSGLFSLSSILASQAQLAKEDKSARDASDSHREEDGDKSD